MGSGRGVDAPCTACQGIGVVACDDCLGNGEGTCSRCHGSGRW
jgi:hypothetical protein